MFYRREPVPPGVLGLQDELRVRRGQVFILVADRHLVVVKSLGAPSLSPPTRGSVTMADSVDHRGAASGSVSGPGAHLIFFSLIFIVPFVWLVTSSVRQLAAQIFNSRPNGCAAACDACRCG